MVAKTRVPKHAVKPAAAPAVASASRSRAAAPSAATPVDEAHGVKLHLAPGSSSGYKGVWLSGKKNRPFMAVAGVGKSTKALGKFATAVEAAVAYAKHLESPKASAAWQQQCVAAREAAREAELESAQEAARKEYKKKGLAVEAEGLLLFLSPNAKSGYMGVQLDERKRGKRFRVEVEMDGQKHNLGRFDTAVEGALVYAKHHQERQSK